MVLRKVGERENEEVVGEEVEERVGRIRVVWTVEVSVGGAFVSQTYLCHYDGARESCLRYSHFLLC